MKRLGSSFVTGIIGVLAGAAIVGGVMWVRDDGGSSKSAVVTGAQTGIQTSGQTGGNSNSSTAGNASAAQESSDFQNLYTEVRPSIVRITTGGDTSDPFGGGAEGLGSGVVLDKDGHILTNYHVVTGFKTVTVTFMDNTTVQADVVGTDPGDDMAVVQAKVDDPSVLVPAKLGDSSQVKIGSVVAAIGNPFALDGTFTTGVISGLDRTLASSSDGRTIRGLLQTDAAVNPGNSGGALIDLAGEVIGINTAIVNPGGSSFAGVAYAVPIDTPKRYLAQLTSGTTITHARLGVTGSTLTLAEAKSIGVPQGVAVAAVERGSGAEKAGLKASANDQGDVIVAIDGQPMKSIEDVATYIDTKAVGDKVTLTVHRDGKDIELTATLQDWDSSA